LTVSQSQTIYGPIVANAVTFNASPALNYALLLHSTLVEVVERPFAVSGGPAIHDPT
jgi:hypothetical protein